MFDLKQHTKITYNHNGSEYIFYVANHIVDRFNTILKDTKPAFVVYEATKFANFVICNNKIIKARYTLEEIFDAALVEFKPAIEVI
ncbi:hypothetical protein [Synechococcus phage BUCT-ZZ01]|nr:hypothetical protein [Synechococcus phage BUCT-ZZ01]